MLLQWSTASETNNDYFTIERSIDVKKWNLVSKIDGAGNSSTVLEYSNIVLVNYYGKESKGIQIFPNPNASVFILDGLRENSEISIFNIKGVLFLTTNAHAYASQFQLDVPVGMYFLVVNSAEGTITQKIIIEK